MEMKTENQVKMGAWDNMEIEEVPALKWEKINDSYSFKILSKKPREIPWEEGVFYVFDIEHKGEKKCVKTSAWSLLKGLKVLEEKYNSLENLEVMVTKKMVKGKQFYEVKDLNLTEEEQVE